MEGNIWGPLFKPLFRYLSPVSLYFLIFFISHLSFPTSPFLWWCYFKCISERSVKGNVDFQSYHHVLVMGAASSAHCASQTIFISPSLVSGCWQGLTKVFTSGETSCTLKVLVLQRRPFLRNYIFKTNLLGYLPLQNLKNYWFHLVYITTIILSSSKFKAALRHGY